MLHGKGCAIALLCFHRRQKAWCTQNCDWKRLNSSCRWHGNYVVCQGICKNSNTNIEENWWPSPAFDGFDQFLDHFQFEMMGLDFDDQFRALDRSIF